MRAHTQLHVAEEDTRDNEHIRMCKKKSVRYNELIASLEACESSSDSQ